MLNFSKTKIFFILAICFAAIIFAAPSFIITNHNSPFLQKIENILPKNKVNLGLDLRGGSQLMLEVDFDAYFKEQLNNLNGEIKSSFRDESVRVIPVINGDRIIFSLNDEEQKKSAKKLIKKLSNKVEIDENSGQFEVYFSDLDTSEMRQELMKVELKSLQFRLKVIVEFCCKFPE
jgi:preprotein translocase subunit SecD